MLPSTGHTHELPGEAKLQVPSSEKLFVVSFFITNLLTLSCSACSQLYF